MNKKENQLVEKILVQYMVASELRDFYRCQFGLAETDWKQLRQEFFKDCTEKAGINETIRKNNMSPHNVFEWFKKKLK